MNSKNKVLIGCLALLLVLSVGYALFSDTITINGTASAKGEFNVTATCEAVEELGGTGTCSIEDDKVITQSSLTKPGDQVGFTVKITNTGTIPTKLKTFITPNNGYELDMVDDVVGSVEIVPGDRAYYDIDTLLAAWYVVRAGDLTVLGDANVLAAAQNLVLNPNDYFEIDIYHTWVDIYSSLQPELPEEGATLSYDIELGFEQVTQ